MILNQQDTSACLFATTGRMPLRPTVFIRKKASTGNKTYSIHLLNDHFRRCFVPNKWLVDNENRR